VTQRRREGDRLIRGEERLLTDKVMKVYTIGKGKAGGARRNLGMAATDMFCATFCVWVEGGVGVWAE
jgi:hypothetical protein